MSGTLSRPMASILTFSASTSPKAKPKEDDNGAGLLKSITVTVEAPAIVVTPTER